MGGGLVMVTGRKQLAQRSPELMKCVLEVIFKLTLTRVLTELTHLSISGAFYKLPTTEGRWLFRASFATKRRFLVSERQNCLGFFSFSPLFCNGEHFCSRHCTVTICSCPLYRQRQADVRLSLLRV